MSLRPHTLMVHIMEGHPCHAVHMTLCIEAYYLEHSGSPEVAMVSAPHVRSCGCNCGDIELWNASGFPILAFAIGKADISIF